MNSVGEGQSAVIALYELPRPIWVDYDVLGSRLATRIGPVLATVCAPTLISSAGQIGPPVLTGLSTDALGAIIGERPPRLDLYPGNAAVIDPQWATEYAANYPGKATALRVIGLELSEDPAAPLHNDLHTAIGNAELAQRYTAYSVTEQGVGEHVARDITGWFTRLAEWLSVLTGQDLEHRHQLYDAQRIAPGFRTRIADRWRPSASSYTVPDVQPAPLEDWSNTLAHIGELKRPPLEWQLLLQAAGARDRGYLRRAVLDSATAAEICLARLMDTSASLNPRPTNLSLDAFSNWLTKHDSRYVKDADFTVLRKLRNDAIHSGDEPDYAEARIAVDCAQRIAHAHGLPRRPWLATKH
jgi:hypothetical protein